ncbi:MAG: hypothetical protein AB7I36_16920 [Rhodospirillaceae bacterium]
MNTFVRPEGPALARLRERFAEIEETEALLSQDRGGPSRRLPASRLYGAAINESNDPSVDVALEESRGARGFYRRTVAASSLFSLPEARAASSGAVRARHGEGCRIRTEQSRAEPSQYFIVVEVTKNDRAAPTSLVVCDSEDRVRRFPLPAVRNGVAQMIAEAGSDLMRLIGDPTTKVFLK